ncbi:hypothetical protein ACJMK2_020320 [Sinanodonta woodiana]|uniref:Uncharacterized protein n=1 Tax=Sinanodonta woodiana TaxID=1069815 RepID=A0ABD3U1G0_SINWO
MAVTCSNDEFASAMENSEMECDYVSYVVNDVLNAEINRSGNENYDRMTNNLDESNTNSLCKDKEISGDERSNNALSKHFEQTKQCSPITDYQSLMKKNISGDYQTRETITHTDNQHLMDEKLFRKVERPEIENDNDADDGICILRKARSDELLTIKHHIQVRNSLENLDGFPTSVSETDGQEYLELQDEYHDECNTYDIQYQYTNCSENLEATLAEYNVETKRRTSQSTEESSTKELPKYVPGTSVKESVEENDENTDEDNEEEDRMIGIEEEYIQRIASLEERQYELEDVIARLTSTVEVLTLQPTDENENGALDDFKDTMSENGATASNEQPVLDKAKIGTSELLMEFQDKIRHFALDLNGVLNCSEAAIRHARVVQEWAISVQKMFEQMKTDRQRMQAYVEEREKTLLSIKDQFLIELQRQNQQVKRIVQELSKHGDLKDKTDKYLSHKVGDRLLKSPEKPSRRPMEESLLDLLMTRRTENDEALVLSMAKQSKISELKLTIISQQNCIQQLQQQNKELRAIIEGLVGSYPSDDEEEEEEDEKGEKDVTKDSMKKPSSPFKLPAEVTGDKGEISQIADVLTCDRGRYFPGRSCDGDIATIQTFQIGDDIIDPTENEDKIFEPLKINYIREQCKSAEEKNAELDMKVDTEGSVCQEANTKKDEVMAEEVENTQIIEPKSAENVPLETVEM